MNMGYFTLSLYELTFSLIGNSILLKGRRQLSCSVTLPYVTLQLTYEPSCVSGANRLARKAGRAQNHGDTWKLCDLQGSLSAEKQGSTLVGKF